MVYFRIIGLIAALFLFCLPAGGQTIKTYSTPNEGVQQFTATISIPEIVSGWQVFVPKGEIVGVFVRFHLNTDSTKLIYRECAQRGLAMIHIGTKYRLEFLFDKEAKREIAQQLSDVCDEFDLPGNNLLFAGMSLEGHRALTMAQFLQEYEEEFPIKARAVVLCDAPLDWIRVYRSKERIIQRNQHPTAVNEASWVKAYLESNLGTLRMDDMESYLDFSTFSALEMESRKLELMPGLAVRAYTEPDIHWWMENRGYDYYDINSVDAAALINALRLSGNTESELIVTSGKGWITDDVRHPHSWSIIDESEMLDWFCGLIAKD
jgi:hypothetical protein